MHNLTPQHANSLSCIRLVDCCLHLECLWVLYKLLPQDVVESVGTVPYPCQPLLSEACEESGP